MGALQQLYALADPVLPADRFLDPMFGQGQGAPRPAGQHRVNPLRVVDRVLGLGIGEAVDGERSRARGLDLKQAAAQILGDQSIDKAARLEKMRAVVMEAGASGANVDGWIAGLDAAESRMNLMGLLGGGSPAAPAAPAAAAPTSLNGLMDPSASPAAAPAPAAPAGPMSLRAAAPVLGRELFRNPSAAKSIGELLKDLQPEIDFVNGVAVDKSRATPGERYGVDLSPVNGFMVDKQDPANARRFFPDLDKGEEPLFDQAGNVVAIRNMDGSVRAAAERAGAIAGAQAGAQAPYEFINTPTPSGAPQVMSKALAAGGVFTGQSPAEAARTAELAKRQAGAQADLPKAIEQAESMLALIHQLRDHPGRKLAVGAVGIVPGVPGTPQKDFIALVDQAKGKAFLEAFQSLKGGGQITEVEGRKATEAIARLDRTQSGEGFLQALEDLESVVSAGLARAEAQAGQGSADPLETLARIAPDAVVTSGYRTPADQDRLRRQGRRPAANSMHLRGEAVDLVPKPGETTAQLAARLRGRGFSEVIDEGDHVHVGFGEKPGRDAPPRDPPPKKAPAAGQRRLTPQEAARLPKGTRFIGTDGKERIRQ